MATSTSKKRPKKAEGISFASFPVLEEFIHKTVREAIFEALELRNIVVNEDFLTLSEVGERFRASNDTVKSWIKQGCPHITLKNQHRMRVPEIIDWLRRNNATPRDGSDKFLREKIKEQLVEEGIGDE